MTDRTSKQSPDITSREDAVEPLARQFGEEILLDYVTGTLDDATRLMVAAQMALRPEISETLAIAGDLAGLMLEEAEPVPMGEGAFADVMAAIDALPETAPSAPAPDAELDVLPAVIRERVAAHGDKWSFVTPGVRAMDLGFEAGEGEVKLYRIDPGYGVPTHTHKGQEMTLVLTGAFGDGRDRYGPGDICVASPEITHKPIAEKGATCYALAITDAPLQLTGALGLVQRVLGS